jgi:hypothetical protein
VCSIDPWIGVTSVLRHNQRVALRHGCAVDSLIHRDRYALGWSSAKWPKDEHLGIVGIDHIDARPVVVRQALRNELNNEFLQQQDCLRSPYAHSLRKESDQTHSRACFHSVASWMLGDVREFERHRVHAVAQARRLRSIVKDMA